jgi:hypothetical protein
MAQTPDELPRWAETLVRFLDDGWRIPGTQLRVGADALGGLLLPVVGDALGALATLALFGLAVQRRVPHAVLLRMAANVGLDTLLGSVPVLGDAFDLVWKANRKNLQLIQRAVASAEAGRPPRASAGDRLFLVLLALVLGCVLALPLVLFGLLLHALR